MDIQRFKKYNIILSVTVLVLFLVFTATMWNASVHGHIPNISLFVVLFVVIISLVVVQANYNRKIFNQHDLDQLIEEHVKRGKQQLLDKLETDKEKETGKKTDDTKQLNEKISSLLPRGNIKSSESYCRKLLATLSNEFELSTGITYIRKTKDKFEPIVSFGLKDNDAPQPFELGNGLNGQVAKSKDFMLLQEIPEPYFSTESGLGSGTPKSLFIAPLETSNKVIGVVELSSFKELDERDNKILQGIMIKAGDKLKPLLETKPKK
jgi:transcriptional regulator with GAF, ATPase, and Fis domain